MLTEEKEGKPAAFTDYGPQYVKQNIKDSAF